MSLRKDLVKIQDIKKIIDHCRGIYEILFKLMKFYIYIILYGNITTCNLLDLETLGSRPIVPKNLPGRWLARSFPWGSTPMCVLASP